MKRFIEVPEEVQEAGYDTNMAGTVRAIETVLCLMRFGARNERDEAEAYMKSLGTSGIIGKVAELKMMQEGIQHTITLLMAGAQAIIGDGDGDDVIPTPESVEAWAEKDRLAREGELV